MRLFTALLLVTIFASLSSGPTVAEEPVTLMGIIAKWEYPGSEAKGATMSDAATINNEGNRTVPSIVCQTTMTTNDPAEKVIEFYKTKLTPDKNANAKQQAELNDGRSVVISDDSEGRPFELHSIFVNTATSSTILIVSRADSEKRTHIVSKHYFTLPSQD